MPQPRKRTMDPDAKHSAILAAGEKLFASKGYTATTIADIAREADVAVGSVYRLFVDKPALLAALHRRMEDRFITAMQSGWQSADDYTDKFAPMIDALMAQAESCREIMPLYALTRDMIGAADYLHGARMIEVIAGQYDEGVRAGAFHPHPPDLIAPMAHGLVEGAMRAFMANPTSSHRGKVSAELKALFQRAFVK